MEIGYGIVPSRRGRGYATETVGAMVDWVLRRDDIATVVARTAAGNMASQRVLLANGFRSVAWGAEPRFVADAACRRRLRGR